MMTRRLISLILLTAFLAGGTGLGEAVHVAFEPDAHDAEHCQVCYVFTTAAIALMASTVAFAFFHVAESRRHGPVTMPRLSRPLLTSAAPRAPPGV